MKFLMTIPTEGNSAAGKPPSPELMAAIAKLGMEMAQAGVMLDTGGIEELPRATRVLAANGQLTKVDGPFAESKELVAGYAVMQVRSKEEAIEMASRFLRVHQQVLGPSFTGQVQIFQMFPQGEGHH
jgi:hypothetical protein